MSATVPGGRTMPRPAFLTTVLSLYVIVVFVQSLFFKFADAPETQHIFGTLDAWAAGFGLGGLFAPTGPFGQYVIGTAELVASAVLAAAFMPRLRALRVPGGLMATGIMSGAIVFHLFTPLGVDVQDDGGLLFAMACGVWISGLVLAWATLPEAMVWLGRYRAGRSNA